MENNNKKMNSSQRLEAVEAGLGLVDSTLGNLAEDIIRLQRNLTTIARRLEAVVRAADAGSLNSASVAASVMEINTQDLIAKVEDLKKQGVAVDSESVKENSFIVGRELDAATKEVVNTRIQFAMFGMPEASRGALLDKKAGDIVSVQEGKNLLEILEVYDIVTPKMESAPAPEASQEGTA